MGNYEPEDSRNITGTKSTPDGRWTNKAKQAPKGVPSAKPDRVPPDTTVKPDRT